MLPIILWWIQIPEFLYLGIGGIVGSAIISIIVSYVVGKKERLERQKVKTK